MAGTSTGGGPTGLGHRVVPSLLVRDMAESLAFYTGRLGFQVTGRAPGGDPPDWAEVARDGVTLWLYVGAPRGTPDEPVMSGTLYFFPDDVARLADELRERVPFAWGPEVMPYGLREFAVEDPNGYLLAFAEPA